MSHNHHIKENNYCRNTKSCKECNKKNKRRCKKLLDCKFHEIYVNDECEIYSISLIQNENNTYSIQNTGTKALCKNYFVCSKNFKTEESLFLSPQDNLDLKIDSNELNTYIVVFAKVDQKNWVRSNTIFLSQEDPIIIPDFEEGITLTSIAQGSLQTTIGLNLNMFLVNPSDEDVYDLTYEITYDRGMFIFIPGTVFPLATVTPDGRVVGYIPFAPKRTVFLSMGITVPISRVIYTPSDYPMPGGAYFDVIYSSPTNNVINEYQSLNRNIIIFNV